MLRKGNCTNYYILLRITHIFCITLHGFKFLRNPSRLLATLTKQVIFGGAEHEEEKGTAGGSGNSRFELCGCFGSNLLEIRKLREEWHCAQYARSCPKCDTQNFVNQQMNVLYNPRDDRSFQWQLWSNLAHTNP